MAENKEKNQESQVWICDKIAVTNAAVSDKGVIYTVRFVDFLGFEREIKVDRVDCYFDFANVLKTLVSKGFRYNTMLAQAPAVIQSRLTAFFLSQEALKSALEAMRKEQAAAEEQESVENNNEATQKSQGEAKKEAKAK